MGWPPPFWRLKVLSGVITLALGYEIKWFNVGSARVRGDPCCRLDGIGSMSWYGWRGALGQPALDRWRESSAEPRQVCRGEASS